MKKKFIDWEKEKFTIKITLETISEMVIIFTAAAAGAVIGSGKTMTSAEWFLATILVCEAVILRRFSK